MVGWLRQQPGLAGAVVAGHPPLPQYAVLLFGLTLPGRNNESVLRACHQQVPKPPG